MPTYTGLSVFSNLLLVRGGVLGKRTGGLLYIADASTRRAVLHRQDRGGALFTKLSDSVEKGSSRQPGFRYTGFSEIRRCKGARHGHTEYAECRSGDGLRGRRLGWA